MEKRFETIVESKAYELFFFKEKQLLDIHNAGKMETEKFNNKFNRNHKMFLLKKKLHEKGLYDLFEDRIRSDRVKQKYHNKQDMGDPILFIGSMNEDF